MDVVLHRQVVLSSDEDHDYPHDFRRIVGPMTERHPTRRQDLHPLVELVGPGDIHAHFREEEPTQPHDSEPGDDAEEGREKESREHEEDLVPADTARAQRR